MGSVPVVESILAVGVPVVGSVLVVGSVPVAGRMLVVGDTLVVIQAFVAALTAEGGPYR